MRKCSLRVFILFALILAALYVNMTPSTAASNTVTLKNGKWATFTGNPYLKVKVNARGYITLKSNYISEEDKIEVYCSKKKKIMTWTSNCLCGKYSIPLEKGTYYLRLPQTTYKSITDNGDSHRKFKIKYIFRKITIRNTSKKSATTVELNNYSKYYTVFYAKDKSKTKYFKFKVSKKDYYGVLYLYSGKPSAVSMAIYTANGKKLTTDKKVYKRNGGDYVDIHLSTKFKLKPGIYYLKMKVNFDSCARNKTIGSFGKYIIGQEYGDEDRDDLASYLD